jgi:gas vesicle protein
MLGSVKKKGSWFFVALGLGAFAGVLFAPNSGCETRKAIATGVDDELARLTTFGRDFRDRAHKIAESGKREVRVAIHGAKGILK